ncbi:MAG: GNAT family N-acetyltransferase [Candidatus Nanopelagicales bacterium]
MTTTVRDATPEDAEALVRIRIVMLQSIGKPLGDLAWVPDAVAELRRQLSSGEMVGALATVDGEAASGALARVWRQLPGDGDDGSRAWIFSVATEEEHRRRGLARAVVTHLVDRLDQRGTARIDLTASEEGEGLYVSLGFAHSPAPLLRRWRSDLG